MRRFPFAIVGFDLDGTLLDTQADLGAALNHALSRAGRRPVPVEHVARFVGGGARLMLARALGETGPVSDTRLEALFRDLLAFYAANIAVHTRLYPGGRAMLDTLAERGAALAVVTNKLESLAVKVLAELKLLDRFVCVIGGDTLGPGRGKPAPDMLHAMLARCAASGFTGRAAFVGDTSYDTLAARAAGMPCVAVSFGFNDRPARDLGADAVIDHFGQLVPTLEHM
jgi:phosphoglycolate phosphatase